MKKMLQLLLMVSTAIILCLPSPLCADGASPVKLTILHINDFHGHLLPFVDKGISQDTPIGGAAYLAAMIGKERVQNPKGALLLSAGDMFQGSPVSNLFRGRPVMEVMNDLKFDAMALGNHEFDWGLDVLNNLRKGARFPYLSANIRDGQGRYLPGVKPYVILKRKNIRVAVIGVTTPETAYTTKPENVKSLTFHDPEQVLPALIAETRSKGAKVIVVLSHLGLDADKELAGKVKGISVIVGGHSHTAVMDPVVVGGTIITQAGCYGIYLGVLNMDVDPRTGRILRFNEKAELKTVKAGPQDEKDRSVANTVEKYDRLIRDKFSRIIGKTAVDLKRSDFSESNIGNLICDAIREATGADVAFTNGGAIRADMPAGPISLEKAYTTFPFDNILVVMDLTGKQMIDILEHSARMPHRIMQVSGLTVRYDMQKPAGERIRQVTVGGQPLVHDKVYRVAANDFLAAGGDQFITFMHGNRIVYGDPLRDVFVSYVGKHSPVHPEIEGRISAMMP